MRCENTCTNSLPSGSSQVDTRRSSSCQLRMCSNISIDITRSNVPSGAKSFTSRVRTVRLVRSRRRASASIHSRWPPELDTPVICAAGYFSASHSDSDPQPQPRSRMRMPSRTWARSQVSASIASSASASVSVPGSHRQPEYLRRGPSISARNSAGSS